ncbi:MAG: diguanylate cyclase [Pseudomonadota bacterium]
MLKKFTNPDWHNRPLWPVIGFALIPCLGLLDYVTGYDFSFSLFYLAPIALVTWSTGRKHGLVASMVSATVWLVADRAAGHPYSHHAILYWNSAIRLGLFVVVALLLSALRKALEREQALARTDYLTGALNARHFYDHLQGEMDRSKRYHRPFTIAYIDIDNFKTVNDRFGHNTGDKVLAGIGSNMRRHLRETDIVGRLGGDEFAVLLPETGQEASRTTISKIRLGLLKEMREHEWPVTFSIGVLTCLDTTSSVADLIKMADDSMYAIKHSSKDGVHYTVCGEARRPHSHG